MATTPNLLSDRINALEESQTIAMSRKSRELAAQGHDVINLSLGEPDFNTPAHIKEAAKKAIDENYSHYPPVAGYADLRKAICDKFKRENGLNYTPDQILVSTGAKQSIANAVLTLINPGDEVLVAAPYWVSYLEIIKLAEGKPVLINTDIGNNFKVTAEQIEAAITPRTKMFMYSAPCNPTGTVYEKNELKAIADTFAKHPGIFILSDEIYEHINFTGKHESIAQFDNIKERVILVNGVSKSYAMTGWRLGFLAAPKWIVDACDKLQGQMTSGACTITQRAAIAAVNSPPSIADGMRKIFLIRRNLVLELMKSIRGFKTNTPGGAFYIFPDVTYYFGKTTQDMLIRNANDLCMYLLNNAHVALVPGEAFGAPGHIRFSYSLSEEKLTEAIMRIKDALDELG